MNQIEVKAVKKIDKLADLVLKGKVENLTAMKEIKKLASELIEFKDFDNYKAD